MGGVVSTGRDNDDLVDNLKEAEYIKSEMVESVFRIVDRAHYYLPECRESAYKDLAWKSGTLHLSAPCIYSEVMEALDLKKGLSFLNLGSGTGYLNTMVGYMIGPNGINHGIELHTSNVSYAEQRLEAFKESSPKFDDSELCEPMFVAGNCLNLAPDNRRYDRVYCGAACPSDLISTVQNMIKIEGILVVPVGDQLLKIKRVSETDFTSENVLPVSFASLVQPSTPKDIQDLIVLPEVNPMSLQDACRIAIRESIRSTFTFEKHTPRSPDESSKQTKLSRVVRQTRGRYPLNILPTNQGLMIMGAFSDDSDDSDGSEQLDGGFLDQQLQRHALVRRQSMELDLAEVDSNISDDDELITTDEEEKSETEISTDATQEGARAKYLRTTHEKFESMEKEDGIVADDEKDDETEMEEVSSVDNKEKDGQENQTTCSGKKSGSSKVSKRMSNKNGRSRKWKSPELRPPANRNSISSDDDVIVAESNVTSSPAIEMSVYDSQTRTIKTSYSTSAETSETSGFGSLGDDHLHIGSIHSGLGNLEDEVMEDKSNEANVLPSCSRASSGAKRSPWEKLLDQSSESPDTATDDDNDDDDDDDCGCNESDSWVGVHTQLADTNRDGRNGSGSIKKVAPESTAGNKAEKKEDAEKDEEVNPPMLPPSGFTVFLKKQVETLPIPNTMKSYICYFR